MVLWQNVLADMLYLLTYYHMGATQPGIFKVFYKKRVSKRQRQRVLNGSSDTTLPALNPVFGSHLDLNTSC